MYGVLYLKQNIIVEVLGQRQEIELSFAEGMIGAIPVFENLSDAFDYADGNETKIFKIEEVKDAIKNTSN